MSTKNKLHMSFPCKTYMKYLPSIPCPWQVPQFCSSPWTSSVVFSSSRQLCCKFQSAACAAEGTSFVRTEMNIKTKFFISTPPSLWDIFCFCPCIHLFPHERPGFWKSTNTRELSPVERGRFMQSECLKFVFDAAYILYCNGWGRNWIYLNDFCVLF